MICQFRKKHISGFSFIELNVAIALFLIAAVALLGILTYCTTAAKKTTQLSQCMHLAQGKMAENLYLAADQIIETTTPVPFPTPFENYKYTIKKLTPSDPKLIGMQELKITVTGSTGAKTDLISMPAPLYTVTYDGNGNTSGAVPADNNRYAKGKRVTVLGNAGNLTKIGYGFMMWNTSADEGGKYYGEDSTFIMGTKNVVLYAAWAPAVRVLSAQYASLQYVTWGYNVTYNKQPAWNGIVCAAFVFETVPHAAYYDITIYRNDKYYSNYRYYDTGDSLIGWDIGGRIQGYPPGYPDLRKYDLGAIDCSHYNPSLNGMNYETERLKTRFSDAIYRAEIMAIPQWGY